MVRSIVRMLVMSSIVSLISTINMEQAFGQTGALLQGPKKFSSGVSLSKSFTESFSGTAGLPAEISIKNGSGANIAYKTCSGNIIAKLLCGVENLLTAGAVLVDRPTSLEIQFNGSNLFVATSYDPLKGSYVFPVVLKAQSSLVIKVKGLPTSSVTIQTKSTAIPNQAPIANFNFTPTSGVEPLFVSFSALSSIDPDGSISSYTWDFGDGTSGVGLMPTHMYQVAGLYSVRLTVKDDKGLSGATSYPLRVLPNAPPAPLFSSLLDTGAGLLNAKFDASQSSDSDGSILRYSWDLGDGSTRDGAVVEHVYATPSAYNVILTVEDNLGKIASISKLIDVRDVIPPTLSISAPVMNHKIVSSLSPVDISIRGISNEPLIAATANGKVLSIADDRLNFTGQLSYTESGVQQIEIVAIDQWNNPSTVSRTVDVVIDREAPVLTIGHIPEKTRGSSIPLSVKITDSTETNTRVIINSVEIYRTSEKEFNYSFELGGDGANTIQIVSVDEAGNEVVSALFQVTRDSTAPVLSIQSPIRNGIFSNVIIPIQGMADEELSSISVDGMALTLAPDKKSFSGEYVSNGRGGLTLQFEAQDALGNIGSIAIPITIRPSLLVKELVGTVGQGDKVRISGAPGATRAGAELRVSSGLLGFNSDSMQAPANGTFIMVLSPFETATLTARDPETGESDSMSLTFNSQTGLSGIIKDVEDNPLPNVKVSIVDTNLSALSTGQGAFSFANVAYGSQVLEFDGSTVPQSVTGPTKRFAKIAMSVNIGVGQPNVLDQTVYLTPLLQDGTQTLVQAGAPVVVESLHAPDVSISIPAGAVTFPTGLKTGEINMMTVASDRVAVPVPSGVIPNEVISLEPSGLKFNQRVPITLPNTTEMPANTDMVVLSMNSSTGSWEVDSLAQVSSDGTKVVSKPGEGISHFSLVYAIPIAPVVKAVKDPKIDAYDSSKDALTTSISLPSYKYGEVDIIPSLTYKSTWARPTA